ncbi:hypothetical protein PWT90_07098 [Aphanocladium album]|nr:hypothetical protein PWT90_07098 [Aphanocladium album]
MAEKEATVFILDLGASMGKAHSGRSESDLDWSMRYVWDKITDIVSANRKTLCVGVVGLRTDGTSNKLQDEDGYDNISVLQELGPMTMTSLKTLQSSIKPSKTFSGDAISAIVVAIDMIDTFTKKLKWNRKIVMITDAQSGIDPDDIGDIAHKINDSNISLTVLGVDFDDPEYGFKEEDKSSTKTENEKTLKALADQCTGGVFASIVEAIDEIDTPRVKQVKPYKSYDGTLVLGDPEKFPSALCINVERYFKTHLARPIAASTVVLKSEQGGTQSTQTLEEEPMDGVEFSAVKQARTYKVNAPDAPGGKKDVEFESLAKGYEYGRTAVHISESEHNITKLETIKSFSIVGFIPWNKYEPFLSMGEVCVTHAKKFDEKSELAMSSLVWGLNELESYAVARLVTKEGKDPILVLLAPGLEPELECLYDIPLPFAEDVRSYKFPPLDKVITVTGQTLTTHRLLPTDDLAEAMGEYVDAMDLDSYGMNAEDEPAEFAPFDETYNPIIHRINNAVKHRAVHPDKPIEDIPSVLLRYANPPQDLIDRVQDRIEDLIKEADVKKVPPKAKGRRNREAIKPISGLDVDALLGEDSKGQITPENAVPDFKRAMATSEEITDIQNAAKQMGEIIESLVTDSFGDSKYAQAVECIGVMREELINMEEPEMYNNFVRELKKSLLSGALGGDRRDFWFKLRWSRLGLIEQSQSDVSKVTAEEAEEDRATMSTILDIKARLEDLESVIGQCVILTDEPEEEPECLLKKEDSGVTQKKEGNPSSTEPTMDGATLDDAYTLSPEEEFDEMGNYRDAAPFDHLKAQDLSDEDAPFCPWRVVKSYPDCYTGKANRPRVRIFFDDVLNCRDWNFFYIRDTRDPKKAHLLVPTRQVQNFLAFINTRLGTELCVPKGPPGRVFYLRFPGCGPFRPRYLLHHKRSSPSEALTAAATSSGYDIEDPHTWPEDEEASKEALKALRSEAETRLQANMALLRRDPNERTKLSAEKRFEKRKEQRKRELQSMLGYLELKDGVVEKESDVVFFCVDVELIEVSPNPISEIGIAVLDMQRVGQQSPGKRGQNWWSLIEAHHIRIKEYAGLTNYRFVHGCPGEFQFGESTFNPGSEAHDAIRAIVKPFLDKERRIVLAGHDLNQDVKYLSHIGFDLKHETQRIGTVDSQVLYQVWIESDIARSLATVLDELGFEYSYLHNAGNDAVHTLRAAIGVAFAATEPATTNEPSLATELASATEQASPV